MYKFDLTKKELLDTMHSGDIYNFNLAQNMALLSNDETTIRNFFQVQIQQYFKNTWITQSSKNRFLRYYEEGQAFCYFGLIPMIVQGKVNLVASNGFKCESDNAEIDDLLNEVVEESKMQEHFVKGAYLESGLGDCLFRISFDAKKKKPRIDVIEPERFEVNYNNNEITSIVVKEASKEDPTYELREKHFLNDAGYYCIKYYYTVDGEYMDMENPSVLQLCEGKFDCAKTPENIILPFRDLMVVFKKNANNNNLYDGERGVPDIQGLVGYEDALTESLSDLIDAIRKGGVKEYVDDQLLPQDLEGNTLNFNSFNKRIITTKGSSSFENLFKVVQGDIKWEAYTRTIQNLMSIAINKAGLSPTTIGLTGLESINSSVESQDAREKPSMRTRTVALDSWRPVLKSVLNKYLQVRDYANKKDILDYESVINIVFNEYTNPTLENITDVLAKQVQNGLKSRKTAIQDLNKGASELQVDKELMQIDSENTPQMTEQINEDYIGE